MRPHLTMTSDFRQRRLNSCINKAAKTAKTNTLTETDVPGFKHLFKRIYCDVDLAPRQTRGETQEPTEAGVTAPVSGHSDVPASSLTSSRQRRRAGRPPHGCLEGAGCLCPTRGTRRSLRTERNSSETGGSETRGRTSRRKTRCDSLFPSGRRVWACGASHPR